MKTIEVSDEIYTELAERVMRSNRTLAEVLNNLLGIADPEPLLAVSSGLNSPNQDEPLMKFITSPEYKLEHSGIGKYLSIFGWLQKHEPNRFQAIEKYQRGKRVYFSKNPKQIAESGKGISVKRIPGTEHYAMVTMDNPTKRRVMGELLSAMGYSKALCNKVAETIVDSGITRSHRLDEYN